MRIEAATGLPGMTAELNVLARDIVAHHHYLTLGTVDDVGRARVSPVYFTHDGHRDYYWVSSPDAHHSRNVALRPSVSFVVFDSAAPVGRGRAVYVDAEAIEVPPADLPQRCAAAYVDVSAGAVSFRPDELSGAADLRLYVARATRHQLHVRGGDPAYGTGIDRRVTVEP